MPRASIIGLYLILGWAALSIFDQLMHTLSPLGLGLLAAGGRPLHDRRPLPRQQEAALQLGDLARLCRRRRLLPLRGDLP
jgi:hypothetical protein